MTDRDTSTRRSSADWPAGLRAITRSPPAGSCPVRERLFLDDGSFAEEALLANGVADGLPADGVVTGIGARGRPHGLALMANDSTVKAGSWGALTRSRRSSASRSCALRYRIPLLYLVDSAGARITDQIEMFPADAAPGASSTTR